jgi:hypothetical protein
MLLPTRRARIVMSRDPVLPPSVGAPNSFACPGCDIILWDEVAYQRCPVCDLPVDWVDLTLPVWCCPDCDSMQNRRADAPPVCPRCDRPLVLIDDLPEGPRPPPPPPAPRPPPTRLRRAIDQVIVGALFALILTVFLTPLLAMALDPLFRYLMMGFAAPIVIIPVILAGNFLWALGASFRELRDLAKDRTTRIIHGLEHAAAKILENEGVSVLGGLTHPGYFELYFEPESVDRDQPRRLRRAVTSAIRRIRDGERGLALHPRCGTSLLVTVLLVALVALAAACIGLLVQLSPTVLLFVGIGMVLTVVVAARPLGLLTQRLLTVSTKLRSARVLRIVRRLEGNDDINLVCYDVHLAVRPRR